MGINGLWPLCSSRKTVSLQAVADSYAASNTNYRALRLGIDAFNVMSIAARAESDQAALEQLFQACLHLFSLTILPLFVFDGRHRPKRKRQKEIHVGPHTLEFRFRAIIKAFGFSAWSAPGEAEAELSMLCQNRFIDYVASNDSDNLLFATPRIIRTFVAGRHQLRTAEELDFQPNLPHYVYESSFRPQALLDRATMVLFALLAGGDYSSPLPYDASGYSGRKDITDQTAGFYLDLAQQASQSGFSLAAELLEAVDHPERLDSWRAAFSLQVKRSSRFSKCFPDGVPPSFPDAEALRLYASPLVTDCDVALVQFPTWDMQADVGALQAFARQLCGWEEADFWCHFTPGLAVQAVRKLALKQQTPSMCMIKEVDVQVVRVHHPPTAARSQLDVFYGGRKVRIWTARVIADIVA